MFQMAKSTSLNLRITPEFRAELEALAEYHGLTLSSYSHSLLVKAVRREREELRAVLPIASQSEPRANEKRKAQNSPIRKTIKVPVRGRVS